MRPSRSTGSLTLRLYLWPCALSLLLLCSCGRQPLSAVETGDAYVTADGWPGQPDSGIKPDSGIRRDSRMSKDSSLVGGCITNKDCQAKQFCYIEGACIVTGAKMGECRNRPGGCWTGYDPVCGCDGKTYANTCAAQANGINAKSKGPCPQTCSDLATQYQNTLEQAKKCNPILAVEQCKTKVNSLINCCPTYVNALNTAALQSLQDIANSWAANKCALAFCPKCVNPAAGACAASGAGHACKDLF